VRLFNHQAREVVKSFGPLPQPDIVDLMAPNPGSGAVSPIIESTLSVCDLYRVSKYIRIRPEMPRRWYCQGIATGDLGESWRILDIGEMIATTASGISGGPSKCPGKPGPVSMQRFNQFAHVTDSKHRLSFAIKYLLRGKAPIPTINRRTGRL
jgi:hypothetical protein